MHTPSRGLGRVHDEKEQVVNGSYAICESMSSGVMYDCLRYLMSASCCIENRVI